MVGGDRGPSLINTPRALPIECSFSPDGRRLVMAAFYGARLRDVPVFPAEGLTHARLWIEVITRMKMDSRGVVTWLEPKVWRDKARQFEKLDGRPVP